jgi:hypothetical protein
MNQSARGRNLWVETCGNFRYRFVPTPPRAIAACLFWPPQLDACHNGPGYVPYVTPARKTTRRPDRDHPLQGLPRQPAEQIQRDSPMSHFASDGGPGSATSAHPYQNHHFSTNRFFIRLSGTG